MYQIGAVYLPFLFSPIVTKMKTLLTFAVLLCPLFLFAQNLRVLSEFDHIKMSVQKYEVESSIAAMNEFHDSKRDNKYSQDGYTYNQYDTSDSSMSILLCFYKNVLYRKVLGFKYNKADFDKCKEEWSNIRDYVLNHYHPVSIAKGAITNKAYGGEIGYGFSYGLSKLPSRFIDIDYSADLGFSYSTSSTVKAEIIGYKTTIAIVDLSKTELNMKTGIQTPEIN